MDGIWLECAACLLAWMSLQLPAWTRLRIQAAALLVCYSLDLIMARAESLPVGCFPCALP